MKHRDRYPLAAIRSKCLDCSETSKYITWCPCDGLHSKLCALWPFRFGVRLDTAREKFGDAVLTPEWMPDANVELEDLPANPRDFALEAASE